MLAETDCLVLATPQTPETEGLIGAAELAALKPGAVVINIARGSVLDEDALIAALESGQVGFAALDVARVEPLPADSPLWDMPNVLISPHSASTVDSENGKLVERFLTNLEHFLAGRFDRLSPQLDKARGY
jgi:phosphoglycerate dehydrogenase-like enzyme